MSLFGFIGCGNMGGALAKAVSKSNASLCVADHAAKTAEAIAATTGAAVTDNTDLAAKADFVVLGVKPQVMSAVLAEIAPVLRRRTDRFTVISMAAGVRIETIEKALGEKVPIIRIMPNTPAAIGEGVIAYAANAAVTEAVIAEFVKAFAAAGTVFSVAESQIDAVSAVSGCGPAFVYQFIEAMADGGVKCGLPRALAYQLAAKTLSGAAQMVLQTGKHPAALKDEVCSPGGSTIVGVEALERGAMRGTVIEAVSAAFEKNKKLG